MDRSSALWLTIGTLAALGAGCVMALQPAVNGKLSGQCSHPLQASVISFGTGFIALLCVGLILRIGFPAPARLAALPWWAWTGGLLGTYMVTVSLLVAPQLGATRWLALVLSGQIALSLVLDHFGLIGYSKQALNPARVLGVTCVVIGAYLVIKN